MVVDITFDNPQSWKNQTTEGYDSFPPKCGQDVPNNIFRLKILAQRDGDGDENPKRVVTL
jgi:hypothetical protein